MVWSKNREKNAAYFYFNIISVVLKTLGHFSWNNTLKKYFEGKESGKKIKRVSKERTMWNKSSPNWLLHCFSIKSLLSDRAEIAWVLHRHHDLLLTYEVPELRVYVQDIKIHSSNYFQGRNRDRDVENRLVGEGESGASWESSIDIYTLPCVKQVTEISSGLCGDLEGWGSAGGREAQERGHICIPK